MAIGLVKAVGSRTTKLMPTSIFRENPNPRDLGMCPSSELAVGS